MVSVREEQKYGADYAMVRPGTLEEWALIQCHPNWADEFDTYCINLMPYYLWEVARKVIAAAPRIEIQVGTNQEIQTTGVKYLLDVEVNKVSSITAQGLLFAFQGDDRPGMRNVGVIDVINWLTRDDWGPEIELTPDLQRFLDHTDRDVQ